VNKPVIQQDPMKNKTKQNKKTKKTFRAYEKPYFPIMLFKGFWPVKSAPFTGFKNFTL